MREKYSTNHSTLPPKTYIKI